LLAETLRMVEENRVAARAAGLHRDSGGREMRLLIVEDNAELSRLVASGLAAAGYESDIVGSGTEAREAAKNRKELTWLAYSVYGNPFARASEAP